MWPAEASKNAALEIEPRELCKSASTSQGMSQVNATSLVGCLTSGVLPAAFIASLPGVIEIKTSLLWQYAVPTLANKAISFNEHTAFSISHIFIDWLEF
jgi:hypothetical protein